MKRLSTVLATIPFIMASQFAMSQEAPTKEQYQQWDAKFRPGLYEFVDFELSGNGLPIGNGSPPARVCIDKTKALFMGRGKSFAEPMKSCSANVVQLNARGLIVGFNCSEPQEKQRFLLGTIVVAETAPDTFGVTVAKQVHAPGQSKEEPVSGVMHAFKRVGDCE